jgi:hypothetical protein
VLLLTVIAGGGRRSGGLDEVVEVALTPSPPTSPAYLACRPERRAVREKMVVSKSVVRGRGRNKGAVSVGGVKIPLPPFSLARESSRHLHGRTSACGY